RSNSRVLRLSRRTALKRVACCPGAALFRRLLFAAAARVSIRGLKLLFAKNCFFSILFGGGSGIRTHVTVSRKHAFQACAFSHSATPPDRAYLQALSLYIETRDVRFCPSYLPDRLSKAAPSEKA